MTGGEVKLTIRAPRELHEAARAKAEAEDVTISQVIRWWLRAWVRGDLPTPSPSEREPEASE
jgi:predicted HicB family RNase H-like nuclease